MTSTSNTNPIVLFLESPNKVKKVQGYVGSNYNVTASKGHIRTLGKYNELGIDIDNGFAPTYLVDANKQTVVATMRKMVKSSKHKIMIIATDFDREGEAIGWHVCNELGIDIANSPRLVFKEITKKGLQDALQNPARLDMNMVYSQQARMILDKLIGYKLCDIIHKYFKNYKLSAGRVQSVVAKLIIERENEINSFKKSNYFKAKVGFVLSENKLKNKISEMNTILASPELTDINEASNIITNINTQAVKFYISDKSVNKSQRRPQPPFITSSLQQEASVRFGMSPKTCMSVAQKLYEAGMITYMRTDSLMLSDKILSDCAQYIKSTYGDEYHKRTVYNKKKSKGAQEAHEACRPVDISKTSVFGVDKCGASEEKLYQLIWKRTVASQMTAASVETRTIKIQMDDTNADPPLLTITDNTDLSYEFHCKFEKILFDGYLKVYEKAKTNIDGETEEETAQSSSKLEAIYNKVKRGDQVWCNNVNIQEQETKAKVARFTEASLVKQLEKLGIGRPSTYASMIDKVQNRGYVEKKNLTGDNKDFYILSFKYPNDITIDKKSKTVGAEKNKLVPTSLGAMITDYLQEHFERFMNYDFTSSVELQLDDIANGTISWNSVVSGVYEYMLPTLDKIYHELKSLHTIKGGSNTTTSNRKRELGINPNTNLSVYVIQTRNGWYICEENTDNKKLSRWGSIPAGLKHTSITLEQALPELRYPYTLGKHKGKEICVCKAKNVYLKYNDFNLSIENYCASEGDFDVDNITLQDAINIINYYDKVKKENVMLSKESYEFEGNKDIIIKNGRFGYYIKYLKMYNIPLPKKFKKDITELDETTVMKAISSFLKKQNK